MAGRVVERTVSRLGDASIAIRAVHALVGRATSGLPRCSVIVRFGKVNPSLNPRLVTRVNSMAEFARGKTLATFTKISPKMGRSNSCTRGDIPASGHKSSGLEGALFRMVSILVGAVPRSSPMCRFVSEGHARNGPCCICVATNTGGFLEVCCKQIGRCLSILPSPDWFGAFAFEPTLIIITLFWYLVFGLWDFLAFFGFDVSFLFTN